MGYFVFFRNDTNEWNSGYEKFHVMLAEKQIDLKAFIFKWLTQNYYQQEAVEKAVKELYPDYSEFHHFVADMMKLKFEKLCKRFIKLSGKIHYDQYDYCTMIIKGGERIAGIDFTNIPSVEKTELKEMLTDWMD